MAIENVSIYLKIHTAKQLIVTESISLFLFYFNQKHKFVFKNASSDFRNARSLIKYIIQTQSVFFFTKIQEDPGNMQAKLLPTESLVDSHLLTETYTLFQNKRNISEVAFLLEKSVYQ